MAQISNISDIDSPAWRPSYWTAYLQPLWVRVCDCYHGLHTYDLKKRYLRQQLGEHDEIYKARIETVAFENRLSPSVKSHAGLLSDFSIADDAPDAISASINDVDGQGNSLESVLLDWDIDGLLYNATMALVDVPPADTPDAQRQNRTPRVVPVPLKDVYSPLVALIDGHLEITRIAIRRSVAMTDGLFGVKVKDRFWVYRLEPTESMLRRADGSEQRYQVTFEVWDEVEGEENQVTLGKFEQVEMAQVIRDASGRPCDRIPMIWYSPYGDSLLFSGVDNEHDRGGTPEYMSLVDLNFEYFNKHSEINTAESRGNFVMLKKTYPGPRPKTEPDLITGNRVIVLEGGADMTIMEPAGTALASTREGQRDRLARMDAIAQSFLTGGDVAMTATQATIEASQSRLGLRNIARRKESAVQQIFYWWERFSNPNWKQGDPVGGITVSESVLSAPPTPQDLQFWQTEFLGGNLNRAQYQAKQKELGVFTEEMAALESVGTLGLSGMGVGNGEGT